MKNNYAIINIRKLAALDIAFHGTKFILIEFALGVLGCAALGLFSLYFGLFHGPNHSLFAVTMGCFLLWIALNYVPLLIYAISIVKHKSAHQEVAYELENRDKYAGKYMRQSTLLLIPLAIPTLAVYQELQKRSQMSS
ncbi:MAG TPA: hypothetical protein VNW73_00275 [Ktedonobacteraceae bacterium]|jgi:hypothetical protein|nr:hypothetical protein [Ktedonobacteraceae bacterium]